MKASQNGHSKVVIALLDKDADVNAQSNSGIRHYHLTPSGQVITNLDGASGVINRVTALMLASQNGHNGIVNALLDKGADVNAKTNKANNDETALSLARFKGHDDIVKLLLEKGAKDKKN
jgi:ankyrin repeat protein